MHVKLVLLILCFALNLNASAQKFSVSFPIGSVVYQRSEISMTVIIENISCKNTVIKCRQGRVSMVGDCQYIYRSGKAGLDTVEVFVRNGKNLRRVGKQVFVVKEMQLPRAYIGPLNGGIISKGLLKAQQGVGAEHFIAGNHWESCIVESFNFIVIRNNKVVVDIFNEGNIFNDGVGAALQDLQHGDKLLIASIQGCSAQGFKNSKALEFEIVIE